MLFHICRNILNLILLITHNVTWMRRCDMCPKWGLIEISHQYHLLFRFKIFQNLKSIVQIFLFEAWKQRWYNSYWKRGDCIYIIILYYALVLSSSKTISQSLTNQEYAWCRDRHNPVRNSKNRGENVDSKIYLTK